MDYEKKYKEALERAKDFMNGKVHYALKRGENIMCWIFPELKESEDERIRKALISFLKSPFVNENITDEKVAPWIAWLEKQGEQKPAEEYNITGISSNKSQGKLGEIIKNLKQEWSEEDENYHRICLDLCTGMPNGGVYAPYIKDEAINWLKSIKDRVGCEVNCTTTKEWSEEDESILQGIWDEILANKHQAKEYEWKTYDRFLSWLKSIRPQNRWKPSEHEITVLEKIQHGEINPSNPTLHRVIKCLKKLMEE